MHMIEKLAGLIPGGRGAQSPRWFAFVRPLYERFLNCLTLGRGVPRSINGGDIIRVSVHHRFVAETYEPAFFAFLKNHVQPGQIILDIGAHIGIYSILLAKWVGPHGRVFSFEPNPATASLLRYHLRLNQVDSRVEVIETAMGDRLGSSILHADRESCQSTLCPSAPGLPSRHEQIHVPLTTVDEFCQARGIRPDWVKIDVEGYELPVLRGMVDTLRLHPNVMVEIHPFAWPDLGYGADDMRAFCQEHNLDALSLGSNESSPFDEYGNIHLRWR